MKDSAIRRQAECAGGSLSVTHGRKCFSFSASSDRRAICSLITTIAPTMTVDVIRLDKDGKRELVPMRWGLIPAWWAKSLKEIPATFNARAESVADKPMFRDAFRGQRCIIPASGFYEWTGDKGNKQPHLFTAADGSPILAFAGLWDRWRNRAAGEHILSCTIIVCGANKWMQAYHDRMPVILDEKDFDGWLDGSLAAGALKCASESALREWLVSKRQSGRNQRALRPGSFTKSDDHPMERQRHDLRRAG
jgi:putative SOS response-associated peptidase YedK